MPTILATVAVIGLVIPLASGPAVVQAVKEAPKKKEFRTPDVIYVPTPNDVVEKMLDMAKVKKGDVVYDLGCGDGRIVVAAAKRSPRPPVATSTRSGSKRPRRTSRRTRSKPTPRSFRRTSSLST